MNQIPEPNRESESIGRLHKLSAYLEKVNFTEYAQMMEKPWKLLWINFVMGMARGLGVVVGLTVVTAVAFIILAKLVGPLLSVPVLGSFLAEIIKATQQYLPRQ